MVSGSWFSLAHSQWSAAWINKDPPPSLSVIELYFIGSLRMHSTNIFDQWYLILFLPTPFASANTIIHSSFRLPQLLPFSPLHVFHICLPSNSRHSCIHFSIFVPSVLYSTPLFIFLFPSIFRRALWGASTAAMQYMIRIFVMYIKEIKQIYRRVIFISFCHTVAFVDYFMSVCSSCYLFLCWSSHSPVNLYFISVLTVNVCACFPHDFSILSSIIFFIPWPFHIYFMPVHVVQIPVRHFLFPLIKYYSSPPF